MATGYIVTGRGDLDALFKARSSAAAAAVGYLSNGGVDLSQRFEPRGSSTAIAATGFRSGAVDLASIFMDIAATPGPNTSHTLVAGIDSISSQIGFQLAGGGATDCGSMPNPITGAYNIHHLARTTGAGPANFALNRTSAGATPPDDDLTFQRLEIVGVWQSGAATRTLVRSARTSILDYTFTGSLPARRWTWNSNSLDFVLGNSYTVNLFRS